MMNVSATTIETLMNGSATTTETLMNGSTTAMDSHDVPFPTVLKWTAIVTLASISVIGFVGGVSTVATVASNNKFYKPIYYFITALVFNDIFLSALVVPWQLFVMTTDLDSDMEQNVQTCRYAAHASVACIHSASLLTFCIAVHRLLQIYGRFRKLLQSAYYIISLVAMCIAIPITIVMQSALMYEDKLIYNPLRFECTIGTENPVSTIFIVIYIITFIGLIIAYSIVFYKARRVFVAVQAEQEPQTVETGLSTDEAQQTPVAQNSSSGSSQANNGLTPRDKELTRAILILILAHFINFMLPGVIHQIRKTRDANVDVCQILSFILYRASPLIDIAVFVSFDKTMRFHMLKMYDNLLCPNTIHSIDD